MSDTIAMRLRRVMEETRAAGHKVSAKSLSQAVGGGETYVGDILRGRVRNPSMSKLNRIAKQLRVPVERLIPEESAGARPELREPPQPELGPSLPLLDPGTLAVILAALPDALKRMGRQPDPGRVSEAIYRAQGWMTAEIAAGRDPALDSVINFLSHIL